VIEQLIRKVRELGDLNYACREFAQVMVRGAAGHKGTCVNPITGSSFMRPGNRIATEVSKAVPRLRALATLGRSGPSNLAMPINYAERERLKLSGNPEHVLWALYASSLECSEYDVDGHPSFVRYASGVLLSARGAILLNQMPFLAIKYPPEELKGLNLASLIWKPHSAH
jgi:hypothetical protein